MHFDIELAVEMRAKDAGRQNETGAQRSHGRGFEIVARDRDVDVAVRAGKSAVRQRLDQPGNDHPRLAIERDRELAQARMADRGVEPGERCRAASPRKPKMQAIDVHGGSPDCRHNASAERTRLRYLTVRRALSIPEEASARVRPSHRSAKKRPGRLPGSTHIATVGTYSVFASSAASRGFSGRSTSSTSAIGALSPTRKPNFRIRR